MFLRYFPFFCAQPFLIPNSTYSPGICLEFSCARRHSIIELDPFCVQSHSSLIPCGQGSLAVYTSFWSPSQPVGYYESFDWHHKLIIEEGILLNFLTFYLFYLWRDSSSIRQNVNMLMISKQFLSKICITFINQYAFLVGDLYRF